MACARSLAAGLVKDAFHVQACLLQALTLLIYVLPNTFLSSRQTGVEALEDDAL